MKKHNKPTTTEATAEDKKVKAAIKKFGKCP